ncbi:MAG TPA: type II toxin-antitoxin system VapC family toxin [Gemmataceae bacterium]|nr:type II toxin-antitoxin system VapC family toxin [Gemmataceae bacterium]
MKYLFDTNTCVQYLRKGITSPVAVKLAATSPGEVVLCSVVVGELVFGALRSQNIHKSIADVQTFRAGFQSLPLDDDVAETYAQVRADLTAKGTPIGPNDMLIAAIALRHGLILVTHNTSEFGRVVGLSLEDWQI